MSSPTVYPTVYTKEFIEFVYISIGSAFICFHEPWGQT